MLPSSAESRSASSSAAYANLRPADDPAGIPAGLDDATITVEIERLAQVRQILWAMLLAAPKNGISRDVVDLAATYASNVRLQINLAALRSLPKRAVKVVGAPVTRDRQP